VSGKVHWLKRFCWALAAVAATIGATAGYAYWWWFKAPFEQTANITYGERNGAPLLLDIFRPPQPNGASVVVMVSGGWKSDADSVRPFLFAPFLRRGYTVFAVRHRSQPECLIGDIVADVNRAVRFIRHNHKAYGIDPQRIGVTGGSSGGHLSLMLGTCGASGPADASDPVDRESSAVQCVACFYPVTDLLNLGESTENPGDGGPPKSFKEGFGPRAQTLEDWKVLGRELSPVYHIQSDMPPTYIVHGDADTLVPVDQSIRFAEAASAAGTTTELVIRPGKKHGWLTMVFDIGRFADWFDKHLLPRAP